MKKIDELVLKILQLNPTKLPRIDNLHVLIYKDITLSFWNMSYMDDSGLVRINASGDAYNISLDTKKAVLKYFKKSNNIGDLLNRINKDIRKEKLLLIGDEN